jgi:vitamin B12/bleomycin/antimicrobial peptide transport system ATP-binding/permease protein
MTDTGAAAAQSWRDVWTLIYSYWRSEEKATARLLLFTIIALTLGMVYMNVQINRWQNVFFNALQDKNEPELYYQMLRFVLLAGVWVVLSVYSQYLMQMLQIRWRRWLTDDYLEQWLADRAYYRMQFAGSQTDNPDQRIAEDLRVLVEQGSSLFLGLLNASVTLASFVGILWALSGPLTVRWGTAGLTIPGYIVWVAVLYALIGNWMTHLIGNPLVALNFARERVEADFRYSLIRFRESMEGVAFYRGERDEMRVFRARFASIFANWWAIMRRQKQLTWFTAGYGQLAVVVPFAVAAPRFLSGAIPLGGLMQTVGAFGYVKDSLSWFMNAYVAFASWKAAVDRLTTFRNATRTAHEQQQSTPGIEVVTGSGTSLQLDHLELDRPTGAPLLATTTLEITPRSKILLNGPSGSGKSTLLRAIAGIWPFGHGVIRKPVEFKALFLPQRPYFPLGSLREAVCYPAASDSCTDTQIKDVLRSVGLARLTDSLDQSGNWSAELSGADQQRIAFARALLQEPTWLFLDEATSNLDDKSQALLYVLLGRRLPNTTLVSIAGREDIASHCARRWELSGTDGAVYELRDLDVRAA